MCADPRPLRILVVDDYPDGASSCAEMLGLYGFDVRATGGVAALALCAACRPNVILLDVYLSGVNGLEVARQLRLRSGTAIRLVAVTGLATPEYRQRAIAAGFDHFLVKPVEPAILVDMLREWAANAEPYS